VTVNDQVLRGQAVLDPPGLESGQYEDRDHGDVAGSRNGMLAEATGTVTLLYRRKLNCVPCDGPEKIQH
jgi:hypothetical protein